MNERGGTKMDQVAEIGKSRGGRGRVSIEGQPYDIFFAPWWEGVNEGRGGSSLRFGGVLREERFTGLSDSYIFSLVGVDTVDGVSSLYGFICLLGAFLLFGGCDGVGGVATAIFCFFLFFLFTVIWYFFSRYFFYFYGG